MPFSTFFKTKAKQGKIKVSFNFTLLIYIVNLNHKEILVTKEATKPKWTKEKVLVALVTISVATLSHAKTDQL